MFARATSTRAASLARHTSNSTQFRHRVPEILLGIQRPIARQTVPRRTFYGHITDTKMAPNLEPYFKQYVLTYNRNTHPSNTNTGLTPQPMLSSSVSAPPSPSLLSLPATKTALMSSAWAISWPLSSRTSVLKSRKEISASSQARNTSTSRP